MKNDLTKYGVFIALLVVIQGCRMEQKQSPINILLIHADQHRIDCIGAYNNKDVLTPNLDQLAADGVLYKNSYVSLPVCTPSRYSLLSGMYVHQHKGWTNHSTLDPNIETFPDILRNAAYKTKAIGKMHFAPTYLDVGFEEMILAEQDGPGRWDDDYHRELMKNSLVDKIDLEDQRKEYRNEASEEYWKSFGTASTNLPEEFYSTNWIANHSLETLENWSGDSSNMLMVGFIKPHHPFDPPEKWVEMYQPDKLTLLPGWIDKSLEIDLEAHGGYFENKELNEAALRKSMAYYYASITQIDFEIGRMISVLKEKGLYANTMIIYTSDHGEHLGYHHQILKGGHLYESIMKVPLIIKYPQSQYAGEINSKLVSNVDLAPTILNAVDLELAQTMSGHDLADSSFSRKFAFGHAWLGNQAMARSEKYKLIHRQNGKSLFFDLEADPSELNNLSSDPRYQEEVALHLEAIRHWQGTDTLVAENYLDENAPTIDQENVTKSDDGHRDEIIQYFISKMAEK